VPNANVTYAEMQSAARQLQAGEQATEGHEAAGGQPRRGRVRDGRVEQAVRGVVHPVQHRGDQDDPGLERDGPVPGRGGQGVPRHRHPARRLAPAVAGGLPSSSALSREMPDWNGKDGEDLLC